MMNKTQTHCKALLISEQILSLSQSADIKSQIVACEAPKVFDVNMESSHVNVLKATGPGQAGVVFPRPPGPLSTPRASRARPAPPAAEGGGYTPSSVGHAPWMIPGDLRATALMHCFPLSGPLPALSLPQLSPKNALPPDKAVQGG